MSDKLRVTETATLLKFLNSKLADWSRKKIKQRLQTGCVLVNGQAFTQHDQPLVNGDMVEILSAAKNISTTTIKLEILYNDGEIIIINKPAGLLSVATATETKRHALALLRQQLSSKQRNIKLWPVHRLDRDTSGVLMFATSREMREAVMSNWPQATKTYLAVVEGTPSPAKGTIDQPLLMDDREYKMHVGEHPNAKSAITHYKIQRSDHQRSLVEVQLETGRQHQIRAHLAWLGTPVVGDPRYGKNGPRMGLHAFSLSVTHPTTGDRISAQAPAPHDLQLLLSKPA